MDKVEKIKIEIERRRNAIDYIGMPTCAEYNRVWAYNDVLEIIDSLPEEPVSEDLDKVAEDYGIRQGAELKPFAIKFFKAGAEWGKNQARAEIQAQSMAFAHGCPEESVSDDLDKAAGNYAFTMSGEDEVSKYYAFKAGANWQKKQDQETIELAEDHAMLAGMNKMKEQMMKDATDVTVHIDAGGYPHIPQLELYDYDNDVPLAKEGDKYKVVLIKEE